MKIVFGQRDFLQMNRRGVNMYIYQLTHKHDGDIKLIGYFSSWKKARIIMKKYRSSVEGFKDYPTSFKIRKIKVNEDHYIFI